MRQKFTFEEAFTKGAEEFPTRYLPFEMPAGATRLEVSYHFSRDESLQPEYEADDVVDMGVFDSRGTEFLQEGFRGWSGGARRHFSISRSEATPGYIRGPLTPGEWQLFIGGRLLHSDTMPYWVHVNIDVDPEDGADEGAPVATPARPRSKGVAGPARWYRGDFHSHTVHSDGYNSVEEYAVAAERLGLDFLAITDHNTWSHFEEIINRPVDSGAFLIPGEEVTTFWGHANVWGLGAWTDFRCRDDTGMQQIVDWVHERGGLFSPNHPKRGYPWEFAGVSGYRVTEAWQGPWRFYNEESLEFWLARLDAGERVVAVGGSDCHSIGPAQYIHPWTLGDPCTWVFAEQPLSEQSVLDAVRAGHVFISEDPSGPFLEFTAVCEERTYMMGDAIDAHEGTPVTYRLRYHGPLEKKLRLYRNGALWQEAVAERDEFTIEFESRIEEPGYVRAEVAGYRGKPERGEVVHTLANPIYLSTR